MAPVTHQVPGLLIRSLRLSPWILLFLGGTLPSCGGNAPCTQLAARCEKCQTIQQPGCKAVSEGGNAAACQDSLNIFNTTNQCK